MIDIYVGGDQGLDRIQGRLDGQAFSRGFAFGRGFSTLEQAAIDQQAVLGAHQQLVAGTGDHVLGAMVRDVGAIHMVDPC
ncbi:hypothetical protein D9M68_660150 [compost metagenome]